MEGTDLRLITVDNHPTVFASVSDGFFSCCFYFLKVIAFLATYGKTLRAISIA
jgi:hypothetical protein